MEIPTTSFYGKRRFERLEEIEEELSNVIYNNVPEICVNIIPGDPDAVTDEEEFDDDDLRNDNLPCDVPGWIEIDLPSDFSDDDDVPLSVLSKNLRKNTSESRKRPRSLSPPLHTASSSDLNIERPSIEYAAVQEPKWTKNKPNFTDVNDSLYTAGYKLLIEDLKDLNPVEIFEKLCGLDVFQLIAEQSIIYAAQKNYHNFTVTANEIRTFIGILILTGYVNVPQERMYWSTDEDLGVPFVKSAMSRDRFLEIKRFLHLADNSKIKNSKDRMYKIRPLMNILETNFCQWGVFHRDLSIDESMIKYFGGHPAKQFIRGKPVRFGYKNWVLSSSTGYCYRFDMYCGKQDESRKIPLGASVILKFLRKVPDAKNHIIFFDNYFSTHNLFATLKKEGIRATGTIRENRTQKCPFISSKEFLKKERGYFDWRFDERNEIIFVRWKDNNVCTMASTYDSVEPVTRIKRWSKIEKKKVDVEQPHLFGSYNSGMGGVDLLDQAISNYRISIRGKKWWWTLFTYFLDMAVVNAWKLHRLCSNESMNLLSFRRNIARVYLRESTCKPKKRGPTPSMPSGLQFDGKGHFPMKIPNQLRCCCCSARVRWQCKKCKKTLCIEKSCFESFHTQ